MEMFIDWDSEFIGKEALKNQKESEEFSVLAGIKTDSRKSPRHGFELFHNDESVGEVTSGTYGASVGYGIGLARVPHYLAEPGTRLTAGPKNLAVEITQVPFYNSGTCRIKI